MSTISTLLWQVRKVGLEIHESLRLVHIKRVNFSSYSKEETLIANKTIIINDLGNKGI